MHNKKILVFAAIVSMVSQVAWARCVCDPADTLCLNNCVNSARDCIESCSGNNGDSCYTGCINVHWPGATFEDLDTENKVITTATTKKATPTPSIHKPATTPTITPTPVASDVATSAVTDVAAITAATEFPVDEILPYLISFFGGMMPTELGALASQLSTLPLDGLGGLPSGAISSLLTNGMSAPFPTGTVIVQTTGVITPPLSSFPINTLGPSLMTTHTTVTSLVTMTPSATDSNSSSHGSKSLVDPSILFITCILLLTSTFILV